MSKNLLREIDFLPPPKNAPPHMRQIYGLAMAELVLTLIVILAAHIGPGRTWGLFHDLQYIWVLQTIIFLWALGVAGRTDLRVTTSNYLVLFSGWTTLVWLVPMIWVFSEIRHCQSIDSATMSKLSQCNSATFNEFMSDVDLCSAAFNQPTYATGVCPEAKYGSSVGMLWNVWQAILVFTFPALNVAILYHAIQLEAAEVKTVIEERVNAPVKVYDMTTQSARAGTRTPTLSKLKYQPELDQDLGW